MHANDNERWQVKTAHRLHHKIMTYKYERFILPAKSEITYYTTQHINIVIFSAFIL